MFKRLAMMAAATAMMTASAAADTVNLKFASFVPERSITMANIMVPFIEDVNADSEGTLQIDFFPGGILGRSPAQQLKLVQDGVADIAFIIPTYTAGRFPDNDIFELPLLIDTVEEGSFAAWRMFEDGQLRGYEGIKVLGLFAGVNSLHASFPMDDLSALEGRKIRGSGYLQTQMIEALGGVPVGGVATEITENLDRGIIDATLLDWNSVSIYRIPEVAEHHLDAPLGTAVVLVAMNQQVYDGLPDAAKAAIEKHAGEAFVQRYVDVLAPKYEDVRAEVAAMEGQQVRELTEEERAELETTFAPIIEEWKAENPAGEERLQALRDILADIRSGSAGE